MNASICEPTVMGLAGGPHDTSNSRRRGLADATMTHRLPSQPRLAPGGTPDEYGRDKGSTRCSLVSHGAAADVLDRGDDFFHRIAACIRQIQGATDAALKQVAQCPKVRVRDIADTDVVAHAGPIGGGVIGAENPNGELCPADVDAYDPIACSRDC